MHDGPGGRPAGKKPRRRRRDRASADNGHMAVDSSRNSASRNGTREDRPRKRRPTPRADVQAGPFDRDRSFGSLAVSDPIRRALDDMGFENPTPIQAEAIPTMLDGRDVVGRAQTGTGKTTAFGIPMI